MAPSPFFVPDDRWGQIVGYPTSLESVQVDGSEMPMENIIFFSDLPDVAGRVLMVLMKLSF